MFGYVYKMDKKIGPLAWVEAQIRAAKHFIENISKEAKIHRKTC